MIATSEYNLESSSSFSFSSSFLLPSCAVTLYFLCLNLTFPCRRRLTTETHHHHFASCPHFSRRRRWTMKVSGRSQFSTLDQIFMCLCAVIDLFFVPSPPLSSAIQWVSVPVTTDGGCFSFIGLDSRPVTTDEPCPSHTLSRHRTLLGTMDHDHIKCIYFIREHYQSFYSLLASYAYVYILNLYFYIYFYSIYYNYINLISIIITHSSRIY